MLLFQIVLFCRRKSCAVMRYYACFTYELQKHNESLTNKMTKEGKCSTTLKKGARARCALCLLLKTCASAGSQRAQQPGWRARAYKYNKAEGKGSSPNASSSSTRTGRSVTHMLGKNATESHESKLFWCHHAMRHMAHRPTRIMLLKAR